MSDKDTGGPAFPLDSEVSMDDLDSQWHGMSLRDYFAATLAPESIASIRVQVNRESLAGRPQPADYPNGLDSILFNFEIDAALRYMFAGAMLKARKS